MNGSREVKLGRFRLQADSRVTLLNITQMIDSDFRKKNNAPLLGYRDCVPSSFVNHS